MLAYTYINEVLAMKRIQSLARVALALFIVSAFFISCSQGLLPSWKTETPVVRMSFGGIASSGERAVARGTGYIYIKPLGGPDAQKNLLYGPYTVNWGKDFTTTALEPGTYSSILIFHSSENLDLTHTFTYEDKTLSVKDILSSTELMTFVAINEESDNEGNVPEGNTNPPYIEGEEEDYEGDPFVELLGDYLGGKTTYGVSGPVVLLPGKVTDVSMTLIPILGEDSWLESYGETVPELTRSSPVEKKEFFAVSGNYSPVNNIYPDITIQLSPSTGKTLKVGTFAIYNKKGTLIDEIQSSLTDVTTPLFLTISQTEQSNMFYIYVEYQGGLTISQNVSPPIESGNIMLSITYSENGDPVLTAPSFEIAMHSTLTVTAPAGFTSYRWLLNGDELTGQKTNICSFVPYDVGAQQGVNCLTIEVFDGTDWYSSVVEFTIPQI